MISVSYEKCSKSRTNVSTGISPAQAPPKSGYTSVVHDKKERK